MHPEWVVSPGPRPDTAQLQAFASSVRHWLDAGRNDRPDHTATAFPSIQDNIRPGDLGVAGLLVPERLGGSAAGLEAACVVAGEFGRRLSPLPYLGSVAFACLLLGEISPSSEQSAALLAAIAECKTTVSVAIPFTQAIKIVPANRSHNWPHATATGELALTLEASITDLTIFAVDIAIGKRELYSIALNAVGRSDRSVGSLDLNRHWSDISLVQAPVRRLGAISLAGTRRALAYARILLASESVAAATAAFEMTVGYLKQRRQFGRPIGAFQALKHRCADLFVELEAATSLSTQAARIGLGPTSELENVAAMTLAAASATFSLIAAECIQLHGGVGFTWDFPAHHYLRRAKTNEALLGTVRELREEISSHLESGRRTLIQDRVPVV